MSEQHRSANASGVAPESDQDIGTDPKHPHPQDRPVDDTPADTGDERVGPKDQRDDAPVERSGDSPGATADDRQDDDPSTPNEPA